MTISFPALEREIVFVINLLDIILVELVVKTPPTVQEIWSSIPTPVKLNAESPHLCDITSELYCRGAKLRRWASLRVSTKYHECNKNVIFFREKNSKNFLQNTS